MNLLRTSPLRWLLLVVIGLMPALVHAAGPVAQGTGANEPIVVLDASGIEVAILGSAMMTLDRAGGGYLTLERIFLSEGATFGPLTAEGAELFILEDGALQQQDERGFWSRMEAPYQMVAEPAEQVAWTASSEASLLRLRLTDATPDVVTLDGVSVERVGQFRLETVPTEPALVYIAEASLSGRGGEARLEHDGPVGLAVESGGIDVLSPSGLEGRLAEGQSTLYPDGAAVNFLGTADDEPASAMLYGVSTTGRTLEGSDGAASVESTAVVETQAAHVSATSDELLALLPASSALSIAGLGEIEDSSLTEQETVDALGGTREAEIRLDEWGWSGNATRSYTASDPSLLEPSATMSITIRLHGFGSEEAAAEALRYFSDVLVSVGYQEVEIDDIGTTTRMIVQPQDGGGRLVAFYARQRAVLYRVGGYSPAGDPNDDVVHVAEKMMVS